MIETFSLDNNLSELKFTRNIQTLKYLIKVIDIKITYREYAIHTQFPH